MPAKLAASTPLARAKSIKRRKASCQGAMRWNERVAAEL
jgi:hypothetical protein